MFLGFRSPNRRDSICVNEAEDFALAPDISGRIAAPDLERAAFG